MFDQDVTMASILDVARLKTDEEIMVDIILSTFYKRFFGCRKHAVRGMS
mgnify:CR=1 FL=1